MLFATRVAGTLGTAWAEGDRVQVTDASGTRDIDMPDDLRVASADPPPPDLLVTAYDLLHSTGIDFGPYTRLCERVRDRVERRAVSDDPALPTFADGVASMTVLDAIRRAAATGTRVEVSS
jgi:predicted dehydrogenase